MLIITKCHSRNDSLSSLLLFTINISSLSYFVWTQIYHSCGTLIKRGLCFDNIQASFKKTCIDFKLFLCSCWVGIHFVYCWKLQEKSSKRLSVKSQNVELYCVGVGDIGYVSWSMGVIRHNVQLIFVRGRKSKKSLEVPSLKITKRSSKSVF